MCHDFISCHGWIISHCLRGLCFVYPFIRWWTFGLLPRWLVWIRLLWTPWVQSFWVSVYVYVYVCVRVDLLGHVVAPCLTFWKTTKLVSTVAAPFYIPNSNTWGFQFLHSFASSYYPPHLFFLSILINLCVWPLQVSVASLGIVHLSCSVPDRELRHGDLVPCPGVKPRPLHWELGVLVAGPAGKAHYFPFFYCNLPSGSEVVCSGFDFRLPDGWASFHEPVGPVCISFREIPIKTSALSIFIYVL